MSAKGLVLVTGANGYIAARVVEAFLKHGHPVRGTVRSKASASGLLAALPEYADKLEIVEVPDITAPGAFDNAVKGVQGIAHLAAPVSLKFTDPEPVINTAVSATRGILESAVKESSVQSVILMSSIAAVQSQREGPYVFTEKDWNDQILDLLAQFGKGLPALGIYAASKVAAEKAFWKFRDDQKPAFAMTAVAPVFVSGPPLVVPRSSSAINEPIMHIWQIISGQEIPPPPAGFSWYVDVRDVADLVVYGVENQDKAGGERYIAAAHFGPPQAAADVLRGAYPEKAEVIKDGNPGEGYEPGFKVPGEQSIDGSKAMKALGRSYRPYEETIVDTAKVLEKVSKE